VELRVLEGEGKAREGIRQWKATRVLKQIQQGTQVPRTRFFFLLKIGYLYVEKKEHSSTVRECDKFFKTLHGYKQYNRNSRSGEKLLLRIEK
jgi:hypothetical protein